MVAGSEQSSAEQRYRWVALSNTTAAVFMSALDGSIVIIALPAIFRGINLDPLAPGNVVYLLWMIMGYRLVQAVLVVTLGRLGDMFGRVRIYNAGFVVFTFASILLSFDPFDGAHGAVWLIGWRVLQAIGGSMLTANSAAILTDAFPSDQRGFALGINQVAAIAGQFVGLVAGGLLASLDWRAVFWVNVPVGIFGTIWAYRSLRDNGYRGGGRIDWWGNVTFAVGLSAVLIAITAGIQPYHHHAMGWTNPEVSACWSSASCCSARSPYREPGRRAVVPAQPVPDPGLHCRQHRRFRGGDGPRWPAVHAHHLVAGNLAAVARIQLRRHPAVGRDLPVALDRGNPRRRAGVGRALGPLRCSRLLDRGDDGVRWQFHRAHAVAGRLLLLGVRRTDLLNGIGGGMFAAPNSASIMSSVPASQRGAASGMRATFQNSGTALSIGVFFSLMIAGLSSTLPTR